MGSLQEELLKFKKMNPGLVLRGAGTAPNIVKPPTKAGLIPLTDADKANNILAETDSSVPRILYRESATATGNAGGLANAPIGSGDSEMSGLQKLYESYLKRAANAPYRTQRAGFTDMANSIQADMASRRSVAGNLSANLAQVAATREGNLLQSADASERNRISLEGVNVNREENLLTAGHQANLEKLREKELNIQGNRNIIDEKQQIGLENYYKGLIEIGKDKPNSVELEIGKIGLAGQEAKYKLLSKTGGGVGGTTWDWTNPKTWISDEARTTPNAVQKKLDAIDKDTQEKIADFSMFDKLKKQNPDYTWDRFYRFKNSDAYKKAMEQMRKSGG